MSEKIKNVVSKKMLRFRENHIRTRILVRNRSILKTGKSVGNKIKLTAHHREGKRRIPTSPVAGA